MCKMPTRDLLSNVARILPLPQQGCIELHTSFACVLFQCNGSMWGLADVHARTSAETLHTTARTISGVSRRRIYGKPILYLFRKGQSSAKIKKWPPGLDDLQLVEAGFVSCSMVQRFLGRTLEELRIESYRTRSSAQGNCSAKSLAPVMSSILPCPCLPPVMLSAGGGGVWLRGG